MKEALVDLYQDIGGAKGKGLKKQKECMEVARSMGFKLNSLNPLTCKDASGLGK